jgi:hypothetical protein
MRFIPTRTIRGGHGVKGTILENIDKMDNKSIVDIKNMRRNRNFTGMEKSIIQQRESLNNIGDLSNFDNSLLENEIIIHLNYVIEKLKNIDPVVHNLMVLLLSRKQSEERLIKFLDFENETYYDKEYALRVCLYEKKYIATIKLYISLNLFENAVDCALGLIFFYLL